jgi:CheY-like chemotaxis protein
VTEHLARSGEPTRRACVLVVDDDAEVRRVIRWALEDEGLAVLTAADGREGLGLATEHGPDLIVLDLTLPGLDGYDVARRLRAPPTRPIPILVITADGHPATKAEQVAAYAFLRKPFRIEDLVEAVHAGLRGAGM